MPFAPHLRVSALGRLGTPEADRFSFSVNLDNSDHAFASLNSWIADHTTDLDDLCDDTRDFFVRANTHICSAAVLDMVKVASIGTDGKYTQDPHIKVYSAGGGGSQNGTELPQAALAVSLNTSRRGPTGRGRFFLPMPNVPAVSTDGFRIPTGTTDEILGSAETWIEALNNQPGVDMTDLHVVVASTKGYNTGVDSIRLGRVVDTIRSRRNKLREMYTADRDVG